MHQQLHTCMPCVKGHSNNIISAHTLSQRNTWPLTHLPPANVPDPILKLFLFQRSISILVYFVHNYTACSVPIINQVQECEQNCVVYEPLLLSTKSLLILPEPPSRFFFRQLIEFLSLLCPQESFMVVLSVVLVPVAVMFLLGEIARAAMTTRSSATRRTCRS